MYLYELYTGCSLCDSNDILNHCPWDLRIYDRKIITFLLRSIAG